MTSVPAFLAPAPILKVGYTSTRFRITKPATCVLEKEKTTADEAPRVSTPIRPTPVHHRVLKSGEVLPPPPQRHWTIPGVRILMQKIFGPMSPEQAARYGGIHTANGPFGDIHLVTDYAAISSVLRDDETFKSAPGPGISLIPNAIITLNGEEHARARARLSPGFTSRALPYYFEAIQRRSNKLWQRVSQDTMNDEIVLLDPVLREHYLGITIEITTGLADNNIEYTAKVRDKFKRMFNSFGRPSKEQSEEANKASKELIEILTNVVRNALVEKADTIEKLRSFGDRLKVQGTREIATGDANLMQFLLAGSELKTGNQAHENDVALLEEQAHQLLLLWFAGYITSAVTSICSSFEMGLDSNIWSQLREEQDAIVNSAGGGGDRSVRYEQLAEMKLLDSFLTEILRTRPVAAGVVRRCESDVEVLGRGLKKGSRVFFDFRNAMKDERYFKDAKEFRIDRFLDSSDGHAARRILTFGPVGYAHYCIGDKLAMVQMKTTFAVLLRNYDMKLKPNLNRRYGVFGMQVPTNQVPVVKLLPRST